MPKRFALFCALLVVGAPAFAQPNAPSRSPAPPLWDHNGSVMYLVAQGESREFHYKEPRQGMLEAGVRPGSVLFRGKAANGEYFGTAFIFDRRCGQFSYPVRGPILDNDERVVLTGQAPRIGAKCRVQGSFIEVLEFRLQNANRTARPSAAENTAPPSLQTEESAAPAPPVASVSAPQQQAPSREPPAAASDRAPAPLAAAVTPPAPAAPTPDLTTEMEKTRAVQARAAAQAEAARAAEASAQRAAAEAAAARIAAEERIQQSREQLQAAQQENSDERSRQNLILAAMSWALVVSGAAIVFLFVKLHRSQFSPAPENASTMTTADVLVHSGRPEIDPGDDALRTAKHHGYQAGGRVRVFFQTRATNNSADIRL
jgi:hypothetical protein